jgi:hypothetical protein
MSAAEIDQALERSNRQKPITEPELAPLSDVELDQLDAELSELTGVVAARRPPDKPPPH